MTLKRQSWASSKCLMYFPFTSWFQESMTIHVLNKSRVTSFRIDCTLCNKSYHIIASETVVRWCSLFKYSYKLQVCNFIRDSSSGFFLRILQNLAAFSQGTCERLLLSLSCTLVSHYIQLSLFLPTVSEISENDKSANTHCLRNKLNTFQYLNLKKEVSFTDTFP